MGFGVPSRRPVYTYQALSATEIRLSTVHEGDYGATVSGEFQTVRLDPGGVSQPGTSTKWEAISYAWEDHPLSHEVLSGGQYLKVTDNLLHLLMDLRHETRKRTLWIDAICINQDDQEEKSRQVSLMQQICSLAERVIIWLPVHNKRGHRDRARSSIYAAEWLLRTIESGKDWSASGNMWKSFLVEHPRSLKRDPFHDVLSRSWFGRMWVVQEAVLAQSLFVHLGPIQMPWEPYSLSILRFMSNLDAPVALKSSANEFFQAIILRHLVPEIRVGAMFLHTIIQPRTSVREAKRSIQPSELLLLCRAFKTSHPSDKVYAVSGLFETAPKFAHQTDFSPDYRKPHLLVYEDFTLWCIKKEDNLDVLAQQRNKCRRERDVPGWISWATDWEHAIDFTTTGSVVPLNERNPSIAHIHEHPPVYRSVSVSLFLKGYVIDTVVSGFTSPSDFKREDMLNWLNFIPDDGKANLVLFGEERPTVESLVKVYQETFRKAQSFTHLWRDGDTAAFGAGNISEENRASMRTARGCFAIAFPFFGANQVAKICAFYGGRALFIVVQEERGDPRSQRHRLVCGNGFINGFEDGKGIDMARRLGLEE